MPELKPPKFKPYTCVCGYEVKTPEDDAGGICKGCMDAYKYEEEMKQAEAEELAKREAEEREREIEEEEEEEEGRRVYEEGGEYDN